MAVDGHLNFDTLIKTNRFQKLLKNIENVVLKRAAKDFANNKILTVDYARENQTRKILVK